MAGAMVIALPLYYWRLHNTEVTEADLLTPTVTVEGVSVEGSESRQHTMERSDGIMGGKDKADGNTTINEKISQAE